MLGVCHTCARHVSDVCVPATTRDRNGSSRCIWNLMNDVTDYSLEVWILMDPANFPTCVCVQDCEYKTTVQEDKN